MTSNAEWYTSSLDDVPMYKPKRRGLTPPPPDVPLDVLPDRERVRVVASPHMEEFLELEYLRKYVDMATRALTSWVPYFDALAFCGMSGAIIAPPLAMALNKTMILVRKRKDDSHAIKLSMGKLRVEGDRSARKYIIVDDFISSGTTRKYIMEEIANKSSRAICLGVLEVHGLNEDVLEYNKNRRFPLSHPNY